MNSVSSEITLQVKERVPQTGAEGSRPASPEPLAAVLRRERQRCGPETGSVLKAAEQQLRHRRRQKAESKSETHRGWRSSGLPRVRGIACPAVPVACPRPAALRPSQQALWAQDSVTALSGGGSPVPLPSC